MRIIAIVLLGLTMVAGCSTAVNFGVDDKAGVKTTVGQDGKILAVESTNGR